MNAGRYIIDHEEVLLRRLLTKMEYLRELRLRQLGTTSFAKLKSFTQQELNDEICPSYKNYLKGRSRRLPSRQMVIAIAHYLDCTQDEMNDLLLTVEYLPIVPEGSIVQLTHQQDKGAGKWRVDYPAQH
ncbi:MAG: hypothetical protein OHK0046_42190 [Anaerolineae bacterium]